MIVAMAGLAGTTAVTIWIAEQLRMPRSDLGIWVLLLVHVMLTFANNATGYVDALGRGALTVEACMVLAGFLAVVIGMIRSLYPELSSSTSKSIDMLVWPPILAQVTTGYLIGAVIFAEANGNAGGYQSHAHLGCRRNLRFNSLLRLWLFSPPRRQGREPRDIERAKDLLQGHRCPGHHRHRSHGDRYLVTGISGCESANSYRGYRHDPRIAAFQHRCSEVKLLEARRKTVAEIDKGHERRTK